MRWGSVEAALPASQKMHNTGTLKFGMVGTEQKFKR